MGNPALGGKTMNSLGYKAGDKILDRYEVKGELGRGSFGEVLEVTDKQDGKSYAMKGLDPSLAMDPKQFMEIKNNFELIKKLEHPSICQNYDLHADRKTKRAFLVMELVRGMELKDWTTEQRMKLGAPDAQIPMPIVLGIAEQIADALDYAHSFPLVQPDGKQGFGVLHRDLKPANIMVCSDAEYQPGCPKVKVIDFGLAAIGQAGINDMSLANVANQRMGTPLYMAPEQWTGKTLTRGVDQWSLAVIIYELAAGYRPFSAKTEMELMMVIAAAAPDMPKSMMPLQWTALKRTLQPDRKKRHRSCLALVKALGDADPATKGKFAVKEKALPGDSDSDPEVVEASADGSTKVIHKNKSEMDAAAAATSSTPDLPAPAAPKSAAEPAKSGSVAPIIILIVLLIGVGVGVTMFMGGDDGKIRREIDQTILDSDIALKSGGTVLDQAITSLETLKLKYKDRTEEIKKIDEALEKLKAAKAGGAALPKAPDVPAVPGTGK